MRDDQGRDSYLLLVMRPTMPHTLLALHGFTGSGEDFTLLQHTLQRPITSMDLHGHRSLPEPIPPYTKVIQELAQWCRQYQHPVLIGYSLGGRLALAVAQQTPLAGLVLIGASPGLASDEERTARREADEGLARQLEREGLDAFLNYWQQQPLIASQAEIASPWREQLLQRKQRLSARGLADTLRVLGTGAQPSYWESLSSINTSCLLIAGERDHKFTAIAAQMEERLPNATRCSIKAAGHAAHLERPEETAACIAAWLKRLHLEGK